MKGSEHVTKNEEPIACPIHAARGGYPGIGCPACDSLRYPVPTPQEHTCTCNEGTGFDIDCLSCFGSGIPVDWVKVLGNLSLDSISLRKNPVRHAWTAAIAGSPPVFGTSNTPVGALSNLVEKIRVMGEEESEKAGPWTWKQEAMRGDTPGSVRAPNQNPIEEHVSDKLCDHETSCYTCDQCDCGCECAKPGDDDYECEDDNLEDEYSDGAVEEEK